MNQKRTSCLVRFILSIIRLWPKDYGVIAVGTTVGAVVDVAVGADVAVLAAGALVFVAVPPAPPTKIIR